MAKKKEQALENEETKTEAGTEREDQILLAQKEEELKKCEEKLAETEDRLLRTLAEYDNFKKRSAREKDEIYFLSKSELIKKLLPVFDNFERAQKYTDAEDYKTGVDMIVNQFFQILEGMEVREIAKVGDEFDPNFHEAVFREEKEDMEENCITEVLQKGYAIGDKVIRHAMVKVSG
ncbi:MAG: nucleotide exchange factor GrpE [Clostridia bacterium]|nr:nucleotide exchange factor GrpE [Clostridia bacterium]